MSAYENYLAGNSFFKNQDYTSAIHYFTLSCDAEPHFKTYEKLYLCYRALNNTDMAFNCINKAFDINGKNDKVAFEYAQLLISYKNDLTEANKILENILERNPSYKPAKELLNRI